MLLRSVLSSACRLMRRHVVAVRVNHLSRQIREKEREFDLADAYEPPLRYGVQASLRDEIEDLERRRAALEAQS